MKYRRDIYDLVFVGKSLKNIYKLNVFDYVLFRSWTKPLNNVNHLTLDVPFRTDRGTSLKILCFVQICRLWNELPLSTRESNILSIFRKNLIVFYYNNFNVNFL